MIADASNRYSVSHPPRKSPLKEPRQQMTITLNNSLFARRNQAQQAEESRNISPSPHRPDQTRLDSAFLADRGVKLPTSSVNAHA